MKSHESKLMESSARSAAGANSGKVSSGISASPVIQSKSANSMNPDTIFRQENEDVPSTPSSTINVSYPSAPHGSVQHSSEINNTYSIPWGSFIENDTLLLEFEYNRSAEATIRVVLTDDQGNGFLAEGSVHWEANSGGTTQYIEFSGFPPRADGSRMGSCDAESILTNNTSESTGIGAYEKIYRG